MSSYIDDLTYRTISDGYDITFPTRKNVVFNGATILDDPRNDRTIVYVGAGSTLNLTLGDVLTNSNNALTKKIVNLGEPTFPQDAATKNYIDSSLLNYTDTHTLNTIFDGYASITFLNSTLLNYTTKNYVDGYIAFYLPLSGGTLSGDLNIGGNDLTNFRTDGIDGYSLSGGAALTEVFEFWPILPADGYCIATVGIRIIAWETGYKTVSGVAEGTVTIRGNGTSITILGTPVWDKVSQGFPSTFDCEVVVDSINTEALSIRVKPGTNNAMCNVYCWMQPAVTLGG